MGDEAAMFGLGLFGALQRARFFPDLATPGGSAGSEPSTYSTRSQVTLSLSPSSVLVTPALVIELNVSLK